MARLNGWQRIGVVLSALWLAFVCFMFVISRNGARPDFSSDVHYVDHECETKLASEPAPTPGQPISLERFAGCERSEQRTRWGQFALVMLAPIALGWSLIYLLIATIRWVATGFRPEP